MSSEINPYAAPAEVKLPVATPPAFKGASWGREYQSARGRANLAIGFTALYLVGSLALAGAMFNQIGLLGRAIQGEVITQTEAAFNDSTIVLLSVGCMIAAFIAVIFLLIWIYPVYRNLPALGNSDLKYTPGWAVGWWFVPIMNLFRPCQVIVEIAEGSDPRALVTREPRAAMNSFIVAWWIWRVIGAIVGNILARLPETDNLQDLVNRSWVIFVAIFATDVPVALMQVFLIHRLQADQDARHRLIAQKPGTEQAADSNAVLSPWGESM